MQRLPPLIAVLACLAGAAAAEPVTAGDRPGMIAQHAMNGIAFDAYRGFWQRWQLVTARYRQDTGELRFTYANDIAIAVLRKGAVDYPDGAVLGKIGVQLGEDQDFPSSLVPSGVRRYQLMVRDKVRFASTDGWGYALFDDRGRSLPDRDGNAAATTLACHACHKLVPDRGFVFSAPMELGGGASRPAVRGAAPGRVPFETRGVAELPRAARASLGDKVGTVRVIRGEIARHAFAGTIDEIRPTLVAEVLRSAMPAALIGGNGAYSLVVAAGVGCTTEDGRAGTLLRAFGSSPPLPAGPGGADALELCATDRDGGAPPAAVHSPPPHP